MPVSRSFSKSDMAQSNLSMEIGSIMTRKKMWKKGVLGFRVFYFYEALNGLVLFFPEI